VADPAVTPEEREEQWKAEEAVKEPEPPVETEGKTEAEINLANTVRQKADEEESKRIQAESEEIITMAKRKGYRVFMYGSNFLNNPFL
jgi:hypothetical protein